METTSVQLPSPPRAEVLTVAELVANVLAGRIRIPEFQRGWKWRPEQVRALFDSLYRGFPIGSLLMWRRQRPAETLQVGPLQIDAPERHDAWAVVDGQQRLWSLVGTLAHPDARPRADDAFAVWFDPETGAFRGAPRDSPLPPSWVPLAKLLDSAELQEWLFEIPLFREQRDLRQRVFEAGKRIGDYRVPVYVVEAAEDELPREIFKRINFGGTPLEEADVFNALVGRAARRPRRVDDLQEEATALGMGEIRRHKLLQCVMAIRGLDVTRRIDDQREAKDLEGALDDAAPALRNALTFLRNDARIPHLRLLPYPVPLIVLTRLFHRFSEPNPRSRTLLVRWAWRGMVSGVHDHGERTRLRAAVAAVEGDEEESVQRLLRLVPHEWKEGPWWVDRRFDGRSAASRVAGLWMAAGAPRHLLTGERLDVARWIDEAGADAFRAFLPSVGSAVPSHLRLGPANRLLHPPSIGVRRRLVALSRAASHEAREVLVSHGIDEATRAALASGDDAAALATRRASLLRGSSDLAQRMAGWGLSDRPSINFLLRGDEADAA